MTLTAYNHNKLLKRIKALLEIDFPELLDGA